MARNTRMTTRSADGTVISIEQSGGGFRIDITRGHRETPEERLERIRYSRRGGYHQDKSRDSRSKVRQNLRKGAW